MPRKKCTRARRGLDVHYGVYIAPDEAAVREHASKGGFPANRVSRVRSMTDPTTAD